MHTLNNTQSSKKSSSDFDLKFLSEFYKLNYTEFQPSYIRLSMTLISKLEFCVSSDLCEKFTGDALLLKKDTHAKILKF